MLMPKRTKFRRPHRVSYEGKAKGAKKVDFGQYGLQMFLARKNCIKYIGNNKRIYTILKSRQ